MESKLQALKVTDLKKLLQDANLPVSGTKAELIKRLIENPSAAASVAGAGADEEDLLGEYEAEPAAKSAPQKSANPAPTAKAAPAARPEATTPAAPLASPDTTAPASKSEESRKADLIAELEKRKARAAKWGMPTGEAEAKLERAIKFGLDASKDNTLSALDGGLKGSNKREARAEAKAANGEEKARAPAKPVETEEEKAARIARQEADEAAKKRRAERFGTQSTPAAAAPAPASDPAEEERKRKRMEKFGADPADKKLKA